MKRTDLTILQRFWLETLWLGARVFAVMPYWFKYYVVETCFSSCSTTACATA